MRYTMIKKYLKKIKKGELNAKDVVFEPKYIKINNICVKADVINLNTYQGKVTGEIHPVNDSNEKCGGHISIRNVTNVEEMKVKTVHEKTNLNITQDVMENDIVLLRTGRHNNVIVNDGCDDRVFMPDVRKISRITKNVFIFMQHDYPNRAASETILTNVRDVKVDSVYWKPAGFDWE